MSMKTGVQKKQEIADKLSMALRSYNAIVSPSQWRGDEEIEAVFSALAYGDGQIDVPLQRLMDVAKTVQGGNIYTEEVRRILKQAHALFHHQHFTYYRISIISELSSIKRIFRWSQEKRAMRREAHDGTENKSKDAQCSFFISELGASN